MNRRDLIKSLLTLGVWLRGLARGSVRAAELPVADSRPVDRATSRPAAFAQPATTARQVRRFRQRRAP